MKNKAISIILAVLLLISTLPLMAAQEVSEPEIPKLSVQIIERELINGTTGEPEPITPTMQVLGTRRLGPGTYRKVDIVIKNVDAELPMPAGRLYGAVLRTDKVGSITWDLYNFWTFNVGDRVGFWTNLGLSVAGMIPDTGKEVKVSTDEPVINFWTTATWANYHEEFAMSTEAFMPGETITKTVYVLAHSDAVIGDTYEFRVILVTGGTFSAGTIVAVTDHTFELDFPAINMWLVIGVVLILAVLVAKWRNVI